MEANMCEKNCMDEKLANEMKELLKNYSQDKSNLIQILNEVQEKYGYIPKQSQIEISNYLSIPMAEIYGVITFYSRFTLEPKGKYNISVCLGTACFVKGSQALLDRLKERLKIDEGGTTPDGKFSIDATRCVGACGLAPVFTINNEVYGKAFHMWCRCIPLVGLLLINNTFIVALSSLHKYVQKHAEEAGYPRLSTVTKPYIQKFLKEQDMKPFKIKYYCEKRDPDFESKMHEVLLVYKQIEMQFDENGDLIVPDDYKLTITVSYE